MVSDYILFILLIFLTAIFPIVDMVAIDVAWIGQLGVSTGFYYWKTKSDNRIKIPIKVIESLPNEMRSDINLTEIITSLINNSQ